MYTAKENMKDKESIIENREMSEDETIVFLQEHGVKPLEDWQPHQPLLYVLEEKTRPTYEGKKPSIAKKGI